MELPRLSAEDVEFAVNQEPRCPCVLVLDISGSMAGGPIQSLNDGLQTLRDTLMDDEVARNRVEIAIVTFGSTVSVAQEFVTADVFTPPHLSASGSTPMGAALVRALDLVEDRKRVYRENSINYYRPWVWLMTDGSPTDSIGAAVQRAQDAESNRRALIYAVGVGGFDTGTLSQLSPGRPPLALKGLNFREMFEWFSRSQSQRSRSNNTNAVDESQHQQVPLPALDGWATTV